MIKIAEAYSEERLVINSDRPSHSSGTNRKTIHANHRQGISMDSLGYAQRNGRKTRLPQRNDRRRSDRFCEQQTFSLPKKI